MRVGTPGSGRATSDTTVPGSAAATASAIEPVPVNAWCSLPIDTMRASTSMLSRSTSTPALLR